LESVTYYSRCQLVLGLCLIFGGFSIASCHLTHKLWLPKIQNRPFDISSSALLWRQSILCKWRFQKIYCICNIYFDDDSKCKSEILTSIKVRWKNMQTKSQLNVLCVSNGFQFAKLFFKCASLGINLCGHWTLDRLYICEKGCVWICLMPSFNWHSFVKISMFGCFRQYLAKVDGGPLNDINIKILTMSTLGFGGSQHIFVKMRGTSACSYSRAVPQT